MATATSKLFTKAASLLIICAVMWTVDGQAQTAKKKAKAKEMPKKEALLPAESSAPTGAPLKFNTEEAPTNKDTRSPLLFKDGANGGSPMPPKPSEMDNSVPEDAPFKTYLGYPKYQLGPTVALVGTNAIWKYSGVDYSFGTSSTAYGAVLRILGTPQIKMELEYQHYVVALDAATAAQTGGIANIEKSEVAIDTYFLRTSFCMIGDSSFFRQFCPGVDIGYDAYPVLDFKESTELTMSSTKDIVVGVNIAYQIPFSDKFLSRFKLGYNYGTGVGNAGSLTSKANSSYFASLAPEWNITGHHSILGLVEYKARQAKLEGYKGSIKDTWETNASTLTTQLGYLYTF